MNATEVARHIQWTPIFKEEWISKWTYPNQNVKDKEAVTLTTIRKSSKAVSIKNSNQWWIWSFWKQIFQVL